MSTSDPKKLLAIAVVWLVLIGLGVGAYRVITSWASRGRDAEQRAAYEQLAEEAKALGIQPRPLPAGRDPEAVRDLHEELQKQVIDKRNRIALVGSTSSPEQGSTPRQKVKLALDSFSGYCLLRSEVFRRDLAAQGIELDLVDDRADYAQRLKALQAGQTNLAAFTIDALIKACATAGDLPPATIVLVIDETRGADAMVAWKKAVPNLDALNRRDARIVVTRDSPSETLARLVLADFNLPLPSRTDCWVDAKDAADVYQKFKAASQTEPKAFVLWEPYVSRVLEDPGSHVLIDSSKFRGRIVDVLVAERRFLDENKQLVQELVKAYLRSAYHYRQASGGMAALVLDDARRLGEPLTETQASRLVQGVWWKNTQENYAHFGLLSGPSAQGLLALEDMVRDITGVLLKTEAIARDPTDGKPGMLFYNQLLRRLHDENFHPSLAGGGEGETIRQEKELPALTAEQWQALVRVGTLQVESLVFARGTAILTDQSENGLRKLVDTLRTWPQYYLEIRGHARKEGDPEANRRLAEERARAAAEFLRAQGVPPARLRTVSTEPSAAGGQAQSVSFVLVQVPY